MRSSSICYGEREDLEQQIEVLRDELERISAADAGCTRIREIPGLGPIVAIAIVRDRQRSGLLQGPGVLRLAWHSCHDSTRLEARRSSRY